MTNLNLTTLTTETANNMIANMVAKYGKDSKEVDFLTRRLECQGLKTEEKLEGYFLMYRFGYDFYWNL